MPDTSTSWYVRSLSSSTAMNLGCELGTRDLKTPGKQQSVVVLAFAYPQKKNGVFGAYTYVPGTTFVSVDQIASVAEWFGYGYWYCVGSDYESHLYVGVGTANYPAPSYSAVTYEHGQAWSDLVIDVDTWFTGGSGCPRGCDGQVSAMGANDIELTWNSPLNSASWVAGYGSVANARELINFGALEGCPTFANPGAQCGNYYNYLWSKDQVMEVTAYWFIRPLPEIYLTNGLHAQQWYLMSKYAANTSKFGVPFNLLGPLTQSQACAQVGGCVTTNNTPQQAWDQLYPLISGDPQTRVNMYFSSDMKWGVKETPVPSSGLAGSPQTDFAQPSWPKPFSLAVPTGEPEIDLLSLPSQIVTVSKAPIHAWEGDFRNAWEGPYNGQYLNVLAGAEAENHTQGLILIDATDPATGATVRSRFLAPRGTGPLQIDAVKDGIVSLRAENGDGLEFDLNSRHFK